MAYSRSQIFRDAVTFYELLPPIQFVLMIGISHADKVTMRRTRFMTLASRLNNFRASLRVPSGL